MISPVQEKEALEKVKNKDYELIFMDIQLSDMDGMQITESIRADSSIRADLPIIALTAHVFKQEQAEFLNSGMNACLEKPISRQVLYTTLCEWLNESPKSQLRAS